MHFVFIFIGIFLILIGLMIWKLKIAWIITGYDPERVTDKDGMARWVGRNLVLMGILIILLEMTEIILPNIKISFIIPAYLIIMTGVSIVTIAGTGKYKSKSKRIK